MTKCDKCKFECGEWECNSEYSEYYIYKCEKGHDNSYPIEDDEICETFEEDE